jgi:TIR domain
MDSPATVRAFISHASDDKERFVRQFAEKLMANGVDVWFDDWEINPGDNPVRKIFDEGFPNCQVVILVMSDKSVQKPWVREEIDAAFVRKVEGIAKLIPIQLDGCEMPECLKTTRWESIADVTNYEAVFQKVLNGIFGHYPKPPLGQPPEYAQAPTLRIANLNRVDALLLDRGCRIAIEQGHTLVDLEPWLESLNGSDLTEEQISESQRILEDYGFIERHRAMSLVEIYSFSITLFGFDEFAKAAIPDFDGLVSQAVAFLVRETYPTGDSLSKALGQPLRVAEHILEMLENNSLIKINRQKGGSYMNVYDVSAKLRRAVSDGD